MLRSGGGAALHARRDEVLRSGGGAALSTRSALSAARALAEEEEVARALADCCALSTAHALAEEDVGANALSCYSAF